MPKLEFLMSYHADLKPPVAVGVGPLGNRQIFDVTGGTFEGPRLKGTIAPSGADWLLADANGVGRLDVRASFQTHDGASVYVQYYGIVVMNEKFTQALAAGEPANYGDSYFMIQPRFETGDPRYAWLNSVVAVGEGRILPNAVEYRVFEVRNS